MAPRAPFLRRDLLGDAQRFAQLTRQGGRGPDASQAKAPWTRRPDQVRRSSTKPFRRRSGGPRDGVLDTRGTVNSSLTLRPSARVWANRRWWASDGRPPQIRQGCLATDLTCSRSRIRRGSGRVSKLLSMSFVPRLVLRFASSRSRGCAAPLPGALVPSEGCPQEEGPQTSQAFPGRPPPHAGHLARSACSYRRGIGAPTLPRHRRSQDC